MKVLYIIVMTLLALGMLFGFAFYISPKKAEWEKEYSDLPVIHGFLCNIARFIINYWWIIILAAGAACGFTLWKGKRTTECTE